MYTWQTSSRWLAATVLFFLSVHVFVTVLLIEIHEVCSSI